MSKVIRENGQVRFKKVGGKDEICRVFYSFDQQFGREVELSTKDKKYIQDTFKRFEKAQKILKAAHDA